MKLKGINTEIDDLSKLTPEIIKVEAQFEEFPCSVKIYGECMENDNRFYVEFNNVLGIRVLDEGDLMMFWSKNNLPTEWIWEVESGGWFDTESSNGCFSSLKNFSNDLKEFFITGAGMCVSVLCKQNGLLISTEILK